MAVFVNTTVVYAVARKINIGKFVHRKTSVLIVTDVAVSNLSSTANHISVPNSNNVLNQA